MGKICSSRSVHVCSAIQSTSFTDMAIVAKVAGVTEEERDKLSEGETNRTRNLIIGRSANRMFSLEVSLDSGYYRNIEPPKL